MPTLGRSVAVVCASIIFLGVPERDAATARAAKIVVMEVAPAIGANGEEASEIWLGLDTEGVGDCFVGIQDLVIRGTGLVQQEFSPGLGEYSGISADTLDFSVGRNILEVAAPLADGNWSANDSYWLAPWQSFYAPRVGDVSNGESVLAMTAIYGGFPSVAPAGVLPLAHLRLTGPVTLSGLIAMDQTGFGVLGEGRHEVATLDINGALTRIVSDPLPPPDAELPLELPAEPAPTSSPSEPPLEAPPIDPAVVAPTPSEPELPGIQTPAGTLPIQDPESSLGLPVSPTDGLTASPDVPAIDAEQSDPFHVMPIYPPSESTWSIVVDENGGISAGESWPGDLSITVLADFQQLMATGSVQRLPSASNRALISGAGVVLPEPATGALAAIAIAAGALIRRNRRASC